MILFEVGFLMPVLESFGSTPAPLRPHGRFNNPPALQGNADSP
jgi:hypothetical protein